MTIGETVRDIVARQDAERAYRLTCHMEDHGALLADGFTRWRITDLEEREEFLRLCGVDPRDWESLLYAGESLL